MRNSLIGQAMMAGVLLAAVAFAAPPEKPPLSHWLFDASCAGKKGFADTAGGLLARPVAGAKIHRTGDLEALVLDGLSDYLVVYKNIAKSRQKLPRRGMSVAGWVVIETPAQWGGIVGVIQDNGDDEHGWILGYNESACYFGLATQGADDGNGRLTYLTADQPYTTGKWMHVAATYDGRAMRIYVNGRPAGESAEQSGDILYPNKGPYVIGAYRDKNEFVPMQGAIRELAVYDRALSPEQVRALFDAGADLLEAPPVRTALKFFVKPYLQWPTPDGMTIMWETDRPADGVVEWGRTNPPTERVAQADPRRIHEVRLDGLAPQTRYFYRVRSTEAGGDTLVSDVRTFQTAVRPETPFAFVVLGDSRSNPKTYRRITDLAWHQRPNFVIHVGDIVAVGTNKRQWIFQCFQPSEGLLAHVPMMPALGNHEQDAHWYYDYFALPKPEYYYDYTWGNAQFFVVDSDRKLTADSEQVRWLEKRMAASKATWKFVYFHHPAFSSDADDYGDTGTGDSTWGDLKVRNAIVPLCEKYNVDIVFAGHIHVYERSWPLRGGRVDPDGGVIYVTTGGAAAGLERFAPARPWFVNHVMCGHHYVYVKIAGRTLEYQAFDDHDRLFDTFTLHK